MTESPRWRKARSSNQNGACVELAHTLTLVRDSKNPAGPSLELELIGFMKAVRAGTLDRGMGIG